MIGFVAPTIGRCLKPWRRMFAGGASVNSNATGPRYARKRTLSVVELYHPPANYARFGAARREG